LPDLKGIATFSIGHEKIVLILCALLLIPVVHGYRNTPVYYNLDSSLPRDLASIQANEKLKEEFNMNSTHMLLMDAGVEEKKVMEMADEMKKEDGVKFVLGLNTVKGPLIPEEFVPEKLKDALISDNYQLLLIGSEYEVASEAVNNQVAKLTEIAKAYDPESMLIGEAPCTKDLIEITDKNLRKFLCIQLFEFLHDNPHSTSLSLRALVIKVSIDKEESLACLGYFYHSPSCHSLISSVPANIWNRSIFLCQPEISILLD
jgi:hypothetical protein